MEFVEHDAKRGGTGGANKTTYRAKSYKKHLRLWIPAKDPARWGKALTDEKDNLYVRLSPSKFAGAYQRRAGKTRNLDKHGSPLDVSVPSIILDRFTDEFKDVTLTAVADHEGVFAVALATQPQPEAQPQPVTA